MGLTFAGLSWDALDAPGQARFWSLLLGRDETSAPDADVAVTLAPAAPTDFALRFVPAPAAKAGQNTIHLDLTSADQDAMDRTVATALERGGRHLDLGQSPDEGHVVLADPEGNELCVIPPDNRFLADTALIGAVNCDGTYELGRFWSSALEWPLVWDHEEETAVQAPEGGSKLTWSGTPLMPRAGRARIRFDLAPGPGATQPAEVERLLALGARPAGSADASGGVPLTDLDGNEFRVAPAR